MATEEDVRRICLSLPEATEKPYAGLPGFRVKAKLFARIRENPDALVVIRPDIEDKEALIAAEPEKFFQIPHYEGHPAVLVRLEAIEVDELEELLTESWELNAPARLLRAQRSSESNRT
ncbi:MAG TPA: MmcQ/YjbR family DNA-binding protein [Chthonomonadaceae bacterium]|nr:MmcQ/YjbR family DNA-binding protein [Chthonomonadaceae bacterium]